jgi:hypothetical protein
VQQVRMFRKHGRTGGRLHDARLSDHVRLSRSQGAPA